MGNKFPESHRTTASPTEYSTFRKSVSSRAFIRMTLLEIHLK